MLQLEILLSPEGWDNEKQEFVEPKTQVLQLEHSLVSLSKWESKWHKPFLSKGDMTYEETLDYIKFMTLSENVDDDVYEHLTAVNIEQIKQYINDPMTATTFSKDENTKRNREIITAEIIYHWMIDLGIPFECENWHLNRLITLVRVRSAKLAKPKKRGTKEIASSYAALNAARRKQLNTKG